MRVTNAARKRLPLSTTKCMRSILSCCFFPDLLRPLGRIHHHRLPKAVIHIRRHCFGRRRPQDVGFPIHAELFINIRTRRIWTKGRLLLVAVSPWFWSLWCGFPMLVADEAWECPGARPRLEPDSRALSSGCLPAAVAAATGRETSVKKK